MGIPGIGGLLENIGVSFGLPILFVCLALVNIKVSSRRKSSGLKMRLSLIFAIGLFAYLICTLMFQDRTILAAIWRQSPIVFSVVFALTCLLVVMSIAGLVYWKLRPELWKQRGTEEDGQDETAVIDRP